LSVNGGKSPSDINSRRNSVGGDRESVVWRSDVAKADRKRNSISLVPGAQGHRKMASMIETMPEGSQL
jgi:hypothetical protein